MVYICLPLEKNIFSFSILHPKRKEHLCSLLRPAVVSRHLPPGQTVEQLVCSAVHVSSKAIVLKHLGTCLSTHFLNIHALSCPSAWVPNRVCTTVVLLNARGFECL